MTVSDWDQRQLCSDGTCTGVIGPDGICKACGRVAPDWGEERRRGMVAPAEDGDEDEDGDDDGDEDEISPSAPAALGEAAEWNRRQLCPDGGCVGVIGPDGTCKVCGTPAATPNAGAAAADDDDDDEDSDEDDEDADDDSDEDDSETADSDEDEDEDSEEDDDSDAKDSAKAAASGDDDLGSRKLCSDGACIGVIGPNGKCKVCGKDAA